MKIEFVFYKEERLISSLDSNIKSSYTEYLESLERNLSVNSLKDLFSISDSMYYWLEDDIFDKEKRVMCITIENTMYRPVENIEDITSKIHVSFGIDRLYYQKDIDHVLYVRECFINAFIKYLKSAGLILVDEVL